MDEPQEPCLPAAPQALPGPDLPPDLRVLCDRIVRITHAVPMSDNAKTQLLSLLQEHDEVE